MSGVICGLVAYVNTYVHIVVYFQLLHIVVYSAHQS